MGGARRRSPLWVIFEKEVRELLRDRRAVLVAFVLPLFLYPLVFLGMSALAKARQAEIASKALVIGVWGEEPGFAAHLRDDDHLAVVREPVDEASLRSQERALFVVFSRSPAGDPAEPAKDSGATLRATLYFLHSVPSSREARERVEKVLERLRESLLEARLAARGLSVDIGGLVRADATDVSEPGERSAVGLGRFLPALLILLLMTGGAFAAIDLVAGEKERGTLETLYVQAVSAGQIAAGKFLVVLAASITALLLNLLGLLFAVLSGLTPMGLGGEELIVPPARDVALALVLLLPFAVLTSALLLAISSYARSYREAQTYLLPLTLVVLVPVGLAAAPQVELSSLLAVVPVANVALATREALGGRLDLVPAVLALASTCLYAWLMVRKAAQLLEREEVVLVIESPPLASDASAEGRERRALAFGALAVLVLYFAAGWLQGGGSIDRVTGILLTLWVVVLGLAVAYPLVTRQSFTTALGLRRPAVASLLLAVPMGAACAVVMAAYGRLQDELLPVPRALEEEFERLLSFEGVPSWLRFFVMAVSPGICEELLWRGSFQEDAGARGRPWRTAAITGLYFGLFHLSAYRFVPTAVVGAVLAGVRMRAGSIFPCMVFHTVFNAVAFFGLSRLARRDVVGITGGEAHWLFGPLAAAGAAAVAAACLWGMRTPRRP